MYSFFDCFRHGPDSATSCPYQRDVDTMHVFIRRQNIIYLEDCVPTPPASVYFNYNIGLYRPIRYSNRLGFRMKTHPRQSQLGNKIPSGIQDSEKLSLISSIVGKSFQIRNCLVLEFDNPRIVEKVIFSLCFVRDNIPYHGKLSRYFQLTKF